MRGGAGAMSSRKPNVYVTRVIPEAALDKLRETCEVKMWDREDEPVPREVLEREIADADGLYCLLTERIDAALLAKAPKLKVVSNMAVGYNNIDVAAATARGVVVTNTPGVLTETTADLTFALLLAAARRIVEAADFVKRGEWKTWSPLLLAGQDVYGATLGIVGMGRIGEAVLQRARGFGMRTLYHNRSRKPETEREYGVTYADLPTLLRESDFVCVLTPLTKETANLIDREQLALMKPTAVLVNTARGGIVNEAALHDALRDGTIWAAGLDVFAEEPAKPDHPLLTLPNVVALPHIGSASIATRLRIAGLAADNLTEALAGRRPPHPVNPEAWPGGAEAGDSCAAGGDSGAVGASDGGESAEKRALKHFAVFLPMKDAALSQQYRAQHLQFLDERRREGLLLANGRFVDGAGGLVIYRAETIEEVEAWVKRDPYVVHEARGYEIHEWDVVLATP